MSWLSIVRMVVLVYSSVSLFGTLSIILSVCRIVFSSVSWLFVFHLH